MFFMGINSGLRISDILPLRVCEVKEATHLKVREKKTGNTRRILMTDTLRNEIQKYCLTLGDSDYLFPSRNGDKPISRVQAWNIINAAARDAGIQDSIGTHSMRKTFGYHFYQKHKDLAILQQIFGHSSQSVTIRYIGITDDMIDQAMQSFSL
ncbi:site-specific integrase [Paenibacillus alkaliterrae]